MSFAVKGATSKKPLKRQLVGVVMLISIIGTLLSSLVIFFVMKSLLIDRVDNELREGQETWAQRGPAWQFDFWSLPSDFTQATYYPDQNWLWSNRSEPSPPDFSKVAPTNRPQTVPSAPDSEGGKRWRVVAQQQPDGSIKYVAKSLDSEWRMLAALAWVEATAGVLALIGIGFASNYFVARALAPLKTVENTALAIAEGDIDRRVPSWSKETEVGKLSYAMNTMVGRLQESLENSRMQQEQMRRFVGDASHELRTPLTSVRGYTELYHKGMVNDPDMVLSKIDEESARMQLLVEDLLALTRAEGAPLNMELIDALELTLNVKDSLRAAYPDRSIEVVPDTPDIPMVNGDRGRLHQVLSNLVTNALKHGGPEAEVTITLRHNLDRVMIDVADNGVGMKPEDAEHIFERFYRADTSRTRSTGGSGLGLAITKSLVEAHGGTVTVKTAPGQGSTFTISLPAA